jgi:hypothetical protein
MKDQKGKEEEGRREKFIELAECHSYPSFSNM